ncbi:MAG: carotenoid biosynthesis protein [Bellilinea sp.]
MLNRKITLGLLFAAGLLSGIALVNATFFHRVMNWLTPVNTLVLFAFAVMHGAQRFGWKRILLMVVTVSAVSLAFESYGVATGEVYGPYYYTDMLGPKFLGLVPLLIPVAWFMMMYASFLMADLVVPADFGSPTSRRLWVAAAAGIVMTAWDLAMDPMMVGGGHWVWETQGAYFGVPLQNFWGWWLTTFTALAIYLILADVLIKQPVHITAVPVSWAIYAYAITGISSVWVGFIFNLEGPGMVGLFAMLPWVIAGLVLAKHLELLPNAN